MGKRGVKRKTRWRTFSIGTPPGEEDEDEGACNGYSKDDHEREKEKNGYNGSNTPWVKSRHSSAGSSGSNGQSNGGSASSSGYGSNGSRSRHDSGKLPSQQPNKIAFNEDEYTRITAPRLDVLFKKSYLQNKAWANMTSMSATPSTTGSQSASHSTADGSEVAEDQQLLDMSTGKFEVNYGTYYDHNNGYYYDYPMMLVAPEIPDQMGSNIMAAIPCAPVPLRPIEWVNPVFVPKLASQQYCYIDHQMNPGPDCAALVDAQGMPLSAVEAAPPINGNSTSLADSASGSVSANGSVTDEPLASGTELQESGNHSGLTPEVHGSAEGLELMDELEPLEYSEMPYIETLPPQPIHMAHVIPPPMGQPYLYPGQFMFGPPVANVNVMPDFFVDEGVMIPGGSMLRCNDMVSSSTTSACANRRRKKKKRKLKGPHVLGKTEDEEEDYSSEEENGLFSPRTSWSESTASLSNNRPLNPECQEFRPRCTESHSRTEDCVLKNTSNVPMLNNHVNNEPKRLNNVEPEVKPHVCCDGEPKINVKKNHEVEVAKGRIYLSESLTNGDLSKRRKNTKSANNISEIKVLSNGHGDVSVSNSRSTPLVPEINETTSPLNADPQRLPESYESLVTKSTVIVTNSNAPSRRKYGLKSFKYVREPTPGPDLDSASTLMGTPKDDESRVAEVIATLNTTTIIETETPQKVVDLDNCQTWINENSTTPESRCTESNEMAEMVPTTTTTTLMALTISATDEDPGFDSQAKLEPSVRPITNAVNEWLKGANTPDLFVTTSSSTDEDSNNDDDDDDDNKDEDDDSVKNEPPKNLQSNPMPALSANGSAEEREAITHSKFANSSEQIRNGNGCIKLPNSTSSKRNENSKRAKRKQKKGKNIKTNKDSLNSNNDNSKNKRALRKVHVQAFVKPLESQLKKKADEICEITETDSDVGMRVAKNSRITMRSLEDTANSGDDKYNAKIREIQEYTCKGKCITDVQAVKTFEKGEIVVSMDGELLLVAPEIKAKDKSCTSELTERGDVRLRKDSYNSLGDDDERSLSNIEEPDVLECWETEIVELTVTPKMVLLKELADDELLVINNNDSDCMEHVQRYYRLQDESIGINVEDDNYDNISLRDYLGTSKLTTVPNIPDQMNVNTCSDKDIPVILPREKEENFTDKNSKLPIDEAFEVYESFYTGKRLPFASMDSKLGKSRLFGPDREGPIPCKAVCCIIQ